MAAADNITTLDNSAFAKLSTTALKSKARKLIHDDAMKDSKVIAERQRDRAAFVNKTVNSFGDAFDNMKPSYQSSAPMAKPLTEEVGEKGIQYDNMLNQRMQNLRESMKQQTINNDSLILQNQVSSAPSASAFLPKEIVESFQKNPIDATKLNPETSILDKIGATNGYKDVSAKPISEERETATGVDYSLIKSIVESAVKKYAVALNKRMLTEGKASNGSELQAMKIGNKFSFIDGKGNIYEAKLKFIKNINDK